MKKSVSDTLGSVRLIYRRNMPDRGKTSSGFLFRDAVIRKREIRSPAHSGHEPGKGLRIMKNIETFGELRNALPSTGKSRVPGINQLRRKAELFFRRETATGFIEIFDNGFFIYEECGRQTVYAVDRCASMKTYDSFAKDEMTEELDPYPWNLILESAATARLDHNAESREQSQSEISIDAEESQNNPDLSVRPEHEIREEEEAAAELRAGKIARMKAAMKKPTARQQEIAMLYFRDHKTQDEIAHEIGKSQAYVSKTINRYMEIVKANL